MNFLDKWLHIIRSCNYDNTYKMAWAKAITEISVEYSIPSGFNEDLVEIQLEDIAKKVIRYYFEQTLYFDLQQSFNSIKPPVVVSIVKNLIKVYQERTGRIRPVKWFKSNIELICKLEYEKAILDIVKALKADVSYRFLKIEGNVVEGVYQYEQKENSLFIRIDDLNTLKQNSLLIFDAINYRWTQMLENFNHSPRLSKKIRIIDEDQIRRKPLGKFSMYLETENIERKCFICGMRIENETAAIDHVIPWSYLYSDDLWNLVFAHQICNSSKSNVIPNEEMIQRLEVRNTKLLDILKQQGKIDKHVSELQMALDHNFVRKFWISCQG